MTRSRIHSKALSSPLGSIDEEGDSVLDEFILDNDSYSADMAAPRFDHPQQHPFASPQFYPPQDESWPTYTAHTDPPPFNPMNAQPVTYPPPQSFHPQVAPGLPPHHLPYGEHPPSWQAINADTNTKQQDSLPTGLASPYDVKTEDLSNGNPMPPPNGLPASSAIEMNYYATSIASPQSENGWLSTSSSSEQSRNPAKREVITRSFVDFPSHMRREGIRKKNARVEIPDGRTIDSIEEEIRVCDPNDEEKLKRLKQYKRLLRNREAAYVPCNGSSLRHTY